MVEFQASGDAVLGSRDEIPHRAVILTLTLRLRLPGSHTLSPWLLAVVRKESMNVVSYGP